VQLPLENALEITTQTVAVVTGATSGIGRETALALLDAGASVVALARGVDGLSELEDLAGSPDRLVTIPGDISDPTTAPRLVETAVDRFGHLDVWVNNAAVMSFGSFEQTPAEAFRRVVDVNLFGYVNGARAALEQFRRQGYGIVVNVSSILGKLTGPAMTPYVTSKFAIQGFSEVLRIELRRTPDIEICNVLPGGVNTALYRQCANYSGRLIRPLYPLQSSKAVARTVLRTIRHPRRERRVGKAGRLQLLAHHVSPSIYERVMAVAFPKALFSRARVPEDSGNVFAPVSRSTEGVKTRRLAIFGFRVAKEGEMHVTQPY
jgi:NAD(P)-dependent dehydrogenase (short-subunit alcohol dehydrogenase family)